MLELSRTRQLHDGPGLGNAARLTWHLLSVISVSVKLISQQLAIRGACLGPDEEKLFLQVFLGWLRGLEDRRQDYLPFSCSQKHVNQSRMSATVLEQQPTKGLGRDPLPSGPSSMNSKPEFRLRSMVQPIEKTNPP